MERPERSFHDAIEQTQVLRPPQQALATFGTTVIQYYLLTEPVYTEMARGVDDTVLRRGTVTSERPRVVTPTYLVNLQGFSEEARRYFSELQSQSSSAPGLLYTYRNEPTELTILSGALLTIAHSISAELDRKGEHLAAVIKGVDQLWDVSLLKFIYDWTSASLAQNVTDLAGRGLLNVDRAGVPREARARLEAIFEAVRDGRLDPGVLKQELDAWGLFPEYEDRFFSLFRRR
ncbi:MAG: hypothetical protein ACE5IG_01200 [Dehalococcoidia bacterium]